MLDRQKLIELIIYAYMHDLSAEALADEILSLEKESTINVYVHND